jgi:hypothetical protein
MKRRRVSMTHSPSDGFTVADAIDVARFDTIVELAELATSYWTSIALAADRRENKVIEVHCRQVRAVTREAFATVKALGSDSGLSTDRPAQRPRSVRVARRTSQDLDRGSRARERDPSPSTGQSRGLR